MAENRISLINARLQLNAGLKKTPGWILNKRRGRLIEKIRYGATSPVVYGDLEKSPFCMERERIFSGTKHFIAEIAHREPKLQVAQIWYRLM